MAPSTQPKAQVGIIGGSGLYELFDTARTVAVPTAYGAPSAPVTIAEVDGRSVAFLPRHGLSHEYPPHQINYRANIDALDQLGVRQIVAPCAVGGLKVGMSPGDLVIPDQLVDWTRGRPQSFHDEFASVPEHARFADPYCASVRRSVVAAARLQDWPARDGGTLVVIDGPRFSTRAESQFFAAQGWSLINMTGHPEAVLARERGICFASVGLVTDMDAGVHEGDGVSVQEVLATFAKSTRRMRELLRATVALLPPADECSFCRPD